VLEPLSRHLPVDRNSRLLNLTRLARAYLSAASLPLAEQYGRYTMLFDDAFASSLAERAGRVPDFYSRLFSECDSDELLDKMMYFDLKTSLPEQLLMLTDKMTMAVSLEARVPYLDHRVVEFAARLPASAKVKGMKLRHVQKQAFRGHLPDYVYKQPKKGFGAPVGVWLRNELREVVDDLLGTRRLAEQGIFNPGRVARLVEDHFERRADHTDQLLSLVVFQIWFRAYGLA
jgi:asparagine synthase (glutamine-hydrolysing)